MILTSAKLLRMLTKYIKNKSCYCAQSTCIVAVVSSCCRIDMAQLQKYILQILQTLKIPIEFNYHLLSSEQNFFESKSHEPSSFQDSLITLCCTSSNSKMIYRSQRRACWGLKVDKGPIWPKCGWFISEYAPPHKSFFYSCGLWPEKSHQYSRK